MINLTQHKATPEQVSEGVVEPCDKAAVVALLTFDRLPSAREILSRAEALAAIAAASGQPAAMIGGAPYLMAPLEAALNARRIEPCYAFSARESVEERQADGTVRKTTVFRHAGWVRGVADITLAALDN